MEGIQSCAPACRGATNAAPLQFQGEGARLAYLNVCEDQSADINIVTAEGDKVTLSSDRHSEVTLLTYEHLAYSNSGYEAEEGQLVDFSEERNVSVSVEGDLNDTEMADIQALLSDLGRMLKGFLTGKEEIGAEADTADLSRYGSLSAFEADFEYHATVQAVNIETDRLAVETAGLPQPSESMPATQSAASIAPTGAESMQPDAPAAVNALSAADLQPAPAVPLDAASKAVASHDDEAARALARKVKESGHQPRRFVRLLKNFLRSLMREMVANHSIGDEQAKRGERILDKFFSRIEESPAGSEVKESKRSLKQQWVSLQYELKADDQMQSSVEAVV
ncbi:MAG: hypothetical protein ACM3KE_15805 [Hyphomicrobiales bacterium]